MQWSGYDILRSSTSAMWQLGLPPAHPFDCGAPLLVHASGKAATPLSALNKNKMHHTTFSQQIKNVTKANPCSHLLAFGSFWIFFQIAVCPSESDEKLQKAREKCLIMQLHPGHASVVSGVVAGMVVRCCGHWRHLRWIVEAGKPRSSKK